MFSFDAALMLGFLLSAVRGESMKVTSCHMQKVMRESLLFKHAVGLMIMFALVVCDNPAFASHSVWKRALIALPFYLWFLAVSRMHVKAIVAFSLVLLAGFLCRREGQRLARLDPEDPQAKRYQKAESALQVASGIITVIGVGAYLVAKQREYGSDFRLATFVFGDIACKNNGSGTRA